MLDRKRAARRRTPLPTAAGRADLLEWMRRSTSCAAASASYSSDYGPNRMISPARSAGSPGGCRARARTARRESAAAPARYHGVVATCPAPLALRRRCHIAAPVVTVSDSFGSVAACPSGRDARTYNPVSANRSATPMPTSSPMYSAAGERLSPAPDGQEDIALPSITR